MASTSHDVVFGYIEHHVTRHGLATRGTWYDMMPTGLAWVT